MIVYGDILFVENFITGSVLLYLTAVIDWYSRCIVGWEVEDTLDTRMVINALKKARGEYIILIINIIKTG